MVGALACFGLFDFASGNSKTSTQNYDNRVGADNGAVVQQGSSAQATDEGIVVRDAGKILSPGSVENSGTITFTGVNGDQLKTVLQSVTDVADKATATAESAQAKFGDILQGAVTKLSEKTMSEGEDARNKNLLWMVLGLLATVGFIFWATSKRR
jgi:hypothetical protein